MWSLLLISACSLLGGKHLPDTGSAESGSPPLETAAQESGEPHDTGPFDADADGHGVATDCDDTDAAVHPGADEVWNELDDDCDGVVDADGDYTGDILFDVAVVYKGKPWSTQMTCPVSLIRQEGRVSFQAVCDPDLSDPLTKLLVGKELTFASDEDDEQVSGRTWTGDVEVVSSSGWDSWAEGSLDWVDLGEVRLVIRMDTFSLEMDGEGILLRMPR